MLLTSIEEIGGLSFRYDQFYFHSMETGSKYLLCENRCGTFTVIDNQKREAIAIYRPGLRADAYTLEPLYAGKLGCLEAGMLLSAISRKQPSDS